MFITISGAYIKIIIFLKIKIKILHLIKKKLKIIKNITGSHDIHIVLTFIIAFLVFS